MILQVQSNYVVVDKKGSPYQGYLDWAMKYLNHKHISHIEYVHRWNTFDLIYYVKGYLSRAALSVVFVGTCLRGV